MTAFIRNVVSTMANNPFCVVGGLGFIGGVIGTGYFSSKMMGLSDILHAQCWNVTSDSYCRSGRCVSMLDTYKTDEVLTYVFLAVTAFSTGLVLAACARRSWARKTDRKYVQINSYGSTSI